MPLRSMSPVTVERTSASVTPLAAAMLARSDVRHAASAWSRKLGWGRSLILPHEHGRVVSVEDKRALV